MPDANSTIRAWGNMIRLRGGRRGRCAGCVVLSVAEFELQWDSSGWQCTRQLLLELSLAICIIITTLALQHALLFVARGFDVQIAARVSNNCSG